MSVDQITLAGTLIQLADFGIGNLASIENMLRKCRAEAQIVRKPQDLRDDCKLILAGVGSFDAAMRTVREEGWSEALDELVRHKAVPCLGVCLGMQLMCLGSEEGNLPGLGWIDARVRRFPIPAGSSLKVPHMGWNTVRITKPNPLISAEQGEQRFYFVHSYYVSCQERVDVLASARHGIEFDAAFSRGNLYGVQFHPEKSHLFGMALMQNFVNLQC